MIFSKLIDVKVLVVTATVQASGTRIETWMIAIVISDFSVIAVNTSTIAVTPIHGYKRRVFIVTIYVDYGENDSIGHECRDMTGRPICIGAKTKVKLTSLPDGFTNYSI